MNPERNTKSSRPGREAPKLRAWLMAGLCAAWGAAGSAVAQGAAVRPVAGGEARVLKAGAATSNISPYLRSTHIGGGPRPHATHIHDELLVRCLVLDDGATRLGFAVVDKVATSRGVFDEAKRRIQQATGIAPERMMMSSTHTHRGARGANAMGSGGPQDDYNTFLSRRIADGVVRAVHNLEPARIGWGAGQVPQHVFNRRWLLKDGKTAPNPFGGRDRAMTNQWSHPDRLKPAGPTNPEVYFLSVQALNGRPIALLANYWLHYVGHTGPAGGEHMSADYFAFFADRIQQLLGADRLSPPFVGIMSNGASGDINHLGYRAPEGRNFGPYEKIRLVANDLADEVMRVHRELRYQDWVELKSAQADLELKMRRPTSALVQRAERVIAHAAGGGITPPRELDYARRTMAAKKWPEVLSVPLQTFRIGGLGIAAIPFETFTEIGLDIKARSPLKDTFTVGLANGAYGYLPTPEQHELGGYETWLGANRVEFEASRKIVDQLLELFRRLD